jgi:hypothetical protein
LLHVRRISIYVSQPSSSGPYCRFRVHPLPQDQRRVKDTRLSHSVYSSGQYS